MNPMNREQEELLLHRAVSAVSALVADEFERRFSSWKKTWGTEELMHLSDPSCVTQGRAQRTVERWISGLPPDYGIGTIEKRWRAQGSSGWVTRLFKARPRCCRAISGG